MDWIEGLLEKWKNRTKNYSLWKSLAAYLVLAIGFTVIAAGMTVMVCRSWQNVIRRVNGITEDYNYIEDGDFVLYYKADNAVILSAHDVISLKRSDERLYKALGLVQLLCIPIYSAGAILLVSFLYYRNKLKEPVFLLKAEMQAIRRNDLSFSCRYDSADEMGDICKAMDLMRLSLIENQQSMWELLEEQRKINAAFAHDLRTPLTVINGYMEMLLVHYDSRKVNKDRLMEIFTSIQKQTKRIQIFSETMKEIHGFEALEVQKKAYRKNELAEEVHNLAEGITQGRGLSTAISMDISSERLYYDETVVMEVLGNLLSNAVRYARERIEILIRQEEEYLSLYVKDDGRGMTAEELYKADSPYYTDKAGEESRDGIDRADSRDIHFGLGLTICKILCKKHGGELTLSNSVEGGAIVCARFFVM